MIIAKIRPSDLFKDFRKNNWNNYPKLSENLIQLLLFTSADSSTKRANFILEKNNIFFNQLFLIAKVEKKEIIIVETKNKYKEIFGFNSKTIYMSSTKSSQQQAFFNSIRNAIAHGNLYFEKGNIVTFYNIERRGFINFYFRISLSRLSKLVEYAKNLNQS
jgi:GTPase Era involved in 16S rRNA processing